MSLGPAVVSERPRKLARTGMGDPCSIPRSLVAGTSFSWEQERPVSSPVCSLEHQPDEGALLRQKDESQSQKQYSRSRF